jgi:hypothetical protein
VQQPHHSLEIKSLTTNPNYVGLVKFLVQPFLESPESLSVDCEMSQTLKRAWVRIAFNSIDKEKVIAAAAELAGQSVYLDIYGGTSHSRDSMSFDEDQEERILPPKSKERESNIPKPVVKPRLR